MKVLIIVPAYNERQNIENVIENLRAKCPDFDYVIIDDGSSDGIGAFCRAKGYNILSHEVNLGLDGAFQTGMRYAYENSYDAAIQFDADGQHLPEYICPMAEKIKEGYDIVIGSRFLNEKKGFSMRRFGSTLIGACIHLTSGKKIYDPTSGMRMFSRRVITMLYTGMNLAPEPDTVCYLICCGAKCCEVPVVMHERLAGKSYLSVSRSVNYMISILLSILLLQWFRKRITMPENTDINVDEKSQSDKNIDFKEKNKEAGTEKKQKEKAAV